MEHEGFSICICVKRPGVLFLLGLKDWEIVRSCMVWIRLIGLGLAWLNLGYHRL